MKKVVNEHALALHTVMVDGACGPVELQVYETQHGAYFAIDGSWLEQVPEDDKPIYIPHPYNEGEYIQLIDSMDEKNDNSVCGDADSDLIDAVIKQLQSDMEHDDYTVLQELLQFVPKNILKGSLPE